MPASSSIAPKSFLLKKDHINIFGKIVLEVEKLNILAVLTMT